MAKFLGYNGVKRLWYKIVNYVTTYANITTTSVNGKQRAQINIGESNIIPVTELSDIIDSTHKISADLIEDGTTNKAYTGTEQTKLNGIESGAEVNQSAFSNVKVGSTTIAADSKTDTLEFTAGSNITLTPDATNDNVTIELSTSPALIGTPTAPTASAGTNTTQIATTAFVQDAIITAGIDSAKFQGTTSKADDYTTELLTGEWKFSTLSSYTRGQYWVVASSGTYAGQVCESGDMIFCITDKGSSSYSASHFSSVQNNIIEMSTTDIDDAILEAENNS